MVVAKILKKFKKYDFIAINSRLLNFYSTDSNAIFNIVFKIRIRIFDGLEKGTRAPNNHEQASPTFFTSLYEISYQRDLDWDRC